MAEESPSGALIRTPSDPHIIDADGNAYSLTHRGQISVDGQADRQAQNVRELAWINRRIWYLDNEGLWRSKLHPGDRWMPFEGTRNAPWGPIPDPRIDAIATAISDLTETVALEASKTAVITAGLRSDIEVLAGGLASISEQISGLSQPLPVPDLDAVSVRFAVPIHLNRLTGEIITMSFGITDDPALWTVIPMIFDNRAGHTVDAPTGAAATVSIDNTTDFVVQLGPDGKSVMVAAMAPAVDGATGTITYTDVTVGGTVLTATLPDVTIMPDTLATSVHFDTTTVANVARVPTIRPPAPVLEPDPPAASDPAPNPDPAPAPVLVPEPPPAA